MLGKQKGMALVLVLYLSVILTTLIAAVTYNTKNAISVTALLTDKVKAEFAANSAKSELLFHLFTNPQILNGIRQPQQQQESFLDKINFQGIPFEFDSEVSISISDNSGKLPIHSSNQQRLYELIRRSGYEPDDARSISDAIGDWIDTDSFSRASGAERSDYSGAGPRNQNLEHLSELLAIQGVDETLYNKISDSLQLYGRDQVAGFYASSTLLAALTSPLISQRVAEKREQGTMTSREFSGMTGLQPGEGGLYKPSRQFTVTIIATVNESVHRQVFGVSRPRSNDVPYYFLSVRKF